MMFKLLLNYKELVVFIIVCWNLIYFGIELISSYSEIVRSVWGGYWNCIGKKVYCININLL